MQTKPFREDAPRFPVPVFTSAHDEAKLRTQVLDLVDELAPDAENSIDLKTIQRALFRQYGRRIRDRPLLSALVKLCKSGEINCSLPEVSGNGNETYWSKIQ